MAEEQIKLVDDISVDTENQETDDINLVEDISVDQAAKIEQGAYDELKDDFGGFAAGTVDKVARVISGAADFLGNTVVAAPEALNYWIASKFFDDDEIDSPEERKALMTAVGAVTKQASPANYAFEEITDGITQELDPLINKHEGKDFVDLAQEGSFLEAGDAFLGDVASALPSVGAAFLGPGGLALIGASTFGGKFEEQLEKDTDATSNALLLNAASSAGGEILSEVFTAGLGGGLTKLAKKLGPKAAKAILRNTGSKLAFSFTGEGLSEVAAEAWDKAGDYALLGDDKAFEGAVRDFGKTFLLGGVIGGGIAVTQISNPVAKQAVENAIQPDKVKESQKKSAAKINALQTQLQDAEQNGDEEFASVLKKEISDERTRLKNSKDKVTNQAEQLGPDQVAELKGINDKLSTYKTLLEDGGYDEAGTAVLRDQISKLEEQQENIFDNPTLQDITKKEPYHKTNRKKSQAVQAKYEAAKNSESGLTSEKINELTEDFRGSATAIANSLYNKIPQNLRRGTFEEFTNAVLYGKRGINSQITSHKSETVPLAAFINTFAKKRALELKQEFTAIGTKDIGSIKEPVSSPSEQPTLEVVSNLGISPKIINDASHAAELFDVKVEGIKTPKDYLKQQKAFFGSRLTKQVQDMLRPKGVSQAEKIKNYNKFVKSKSPYLKELYINADGQSKVRRGPTALWNSKTTNQEFVNYITGADLDLTNKTDAKTLTKRKEVLEKNIAEALGQKAWLDYVDGNPEAQKRVNEITKVKEHRTLESIKPGSSTDYAFQEDTQPADDDFAAQSQATNKVLEENGQDKLPDSKDPKQYDEMRDWVANTMTQYFPRSFFNSGNFWNAGTSAAKRGFFFETEVDFDAHTEGLKFKGKDVYSEAQRYHYKKHSVEKILKDKGTIEARNKANVAAFNEMWKTFDKMIKADPKNARMVAAFLKSAQNSQNHFSRTGAPIVAYSKTGPYTEEHAMPQSAVSRYLLNTALSGGSIDSALKNTNKNFVQVALNTTDDASLKQNKIGPNGANLNSNMPAGWKPSDNWLARYFNDTSQIDPDSIVFLESGKTVTETYAPQLKEQRIPKAPTDNLGKRVGAEFRFNKDVVADAVADQTPKKIQASLKSLHDAAKNADHSVNQGEAVGMILQKVWDGEVEVSYDPVEAKERMLEQGLKEDYIDDILDRSYGFAFGNFIYFDPQQTGPDTAFHELGHVWNGLMKNKSPEAYREIFEKLRHEAPEVFANQLTRLKDGFYDFDVNSDEWIDEIMAGVIGDHGGARLNNKNPEAKSISQIVDAYWAKVKELLGFDFAGKDIGDLKIEQALDLIVDEIATGKVGKNISQLNDSGWAKASKARRGIHISLKGDPQYDGLQAVKDNYRETKDLGKALEAGYQVVKESFDKDTWLEFADGALKEAQVGDSTALSIAKGQWLEANNRSLEAVKKARLEKPSDSDISIAKGKILSVKPPRKANSFFLTPKAEDFEGLLYTLLPKGKAGIAMKEAFDKFLIQPYNKGLETLYKSHSEYLSAWKKLTDGVEINKVVTPGYTAGDAIKAATLVARGEDTGLPKDIESLLIDYTNTIPGIVEAFNAFELTVDPSEIGLPIALTINQQIVENLRKQHLEVFNDNLDTFGLNPNKESEVWDHLENNLGEDYTGAFKNILRRMKTGKNRLTSTPANPILQWLGLATSTTMFWNRRSAFLQILSAFNYLGLPNNNILQSSKALINVPQFTKDVSKLWNSPYLKDRRKGAKFDVLADELTGESSGGWVAKQVNKIFTGKFGGFAPTRLVDSFAIASGGAAFYRNTVDALVAQGESLKDAEAIAYSKWIETSEKTQQSADPSKISQIQADDLGKIFFAFANTPFQYARHAKRKLQDVAQGRSKNPRKDLQTAFYFTVGQSAIFTGLQTGALALAFADDEDDAAKDKNLLALDRLVSGQLKPLGYGGAAAATASSILFEVYRQKELGYKKDPARIAGALLGASPVISSKYRNVEQAAKKLGQGKNLEAGAQAVEAVSGLPTAKLLRDIDNIKAAHDQNLEAWKAVWIYLGWSKWDFVNFGPKDILDIDFPTDAELNAEIESSLNDINFVDDISSPLNKDEVGQAFKDGTIEVDPNQSPEEQAKTVEHEMQHQHDMQSGKLDYDDNSVTWNGSAFKRKGGKIQFKGSWVEEGHPSLPWEAKAFDAESDSPLKRVTGSEVKNARKNAERENIRPGVLEQTKGHEGWREKAYLDQIGIPTIGYGQTTINGKPVELGQTISEEEGEKFISNRLRRDKAYIREYFKQKGYKDINENHLEALSQFTYNAGIGRIDSLTKGGTRSIKEISDSLLKYDMAGGKKQKFLTTRREEEKQLFDTPWAERVSAIQEQGVQLPEPEEATAETPFKRGKGGIVPKSKKQARRPSDSRTAARQTRLRQNEANARIAAIQDEEYVQRFINPETGNVDLKAMSEYEHLRGGGTVRNGSLVGNSTVWGLGGPAKGAVKAAGVIGRKLLKGAGLYGKFDDTNLLRERYQTHKDTGSVLKRKKFKKRK